MDYFISVINIVGALVAYAGTSLLIFWITGWFSERSQYSELEDISLKLGIPLAELKNDEKIQVYYKEIMKYSASRYSSELFINRFSDFCGDIRTLWNWVGRLAIASLFLLCVFHTYSDDLDHSSKAWLIIPLLLFFWIINVFFSITCRLLTGRFPGQAKIARKDGTQAIENYKR